MDEIFFRDANGLIRVLISAVFAYALVVTGVRLAGKRATSQMNNFDWIVTVAIGSIVGSTIVLRDLPLIEGLAAIATLLVAQGLVTKASTLWDPVSVAMYAEPTILYFSDRFVESAMAKERVTKQEILAAVRQAGYHTLEQVGAVVLETDAKLSVLPAADEPYCDDHTSLACVPNFDNLAETDGDVECEQKSDSPPEGKATC